MNECDAARGYMKTEMPAEVVHPRGTTPETVLLQNYISGKAEEVVRAGRFLSIDDLINTALAYFLVEAV